MHPNSWALTAADAEMLAFSSACLVDSPCRYTHLAALDTARTAAYWGSS